MDELSDKLSMEMRNFQADMIVLSFFLSVMLSSGSPYLIKTLADDSCSSFSISFHHLVKPSTELKLGHGLYRNMDSGSGRRPCLSWKLFDLILFLPQLYVLQPHACLHAIALIHIFRTSLYYIGSTSFLDYGN